MEYRPQIIASDLDGLQVVSACSTGAKVRVADIKFLLSNKVFLLSIERTKIETDQEDKRINSVLRFNNVLKVKSKNIDQNKKELEIELMAIDYLKNNSDYEIISMGHRNPQGLYFDKQNEFILETEHGPNGGDEINLIEIDKIKDDEIQNFGWAIVSDGDHYGGRIEGKTDKKYGVAGDQVFAPQETTTTYISNLSLIHISEPTRQEARS